MTILKLMSPTTKTSAFSPTPVSVATVPVSQSMPTLVIKVTNLVGMARFEVVDDQGVGGPSFSIPGPITRSADVRFSVNFKRDYVDLAVGAEADFLARALISSGMSKRSLAISTLYSTLWTVI